MLKTIAIVLALSIAAVLAYATTRPSDFAVTRSIDIQAPPAKIFPLVADFRQWASWSPYEKLDPAMQRTYAGAASGPGAVYAWSSSGKAGIGRMQILAAPAPREVDIQLDFTKPMEASNRARFTLEPTGASTRVTWTMTGPSPYVAKVVGIFLDMDTLIGTDFEAGLTSLKALAER